MRQLQDEGRRGFLRASLTGVAGLAAASLPGAAQAAPFPGGRLQVWSCGGLAEAMQPAHADYERRSGAAVVYTGAFAAALGKSLLGSGSTEVFAGRVLDLAKKLRAEGRMIYFKPLCFTSYVIVTPTGNPGNVRSVDDMARKGVRVAMAPEASPPGGAAVMGLLKKAGCQDAVMANVANPGTCVQRSVEAVTTGKADAMIVELRVTRLPQFAGKLDIVEIPAGLFPPPPLTFTVGVMQEARDRALADDYVTWVTSPDGQAHFERAGFIPAISPRGQELVEKLGVKDV